MFAAANSSARAQPLVVQSRRSSWPRRAPTTRGGCHLAASEVVSAARGKYLRASVATFSSHTRTVSAQQTEAPGLDEETVTRLRADTPGLEGFVERTPEAVAHFNNAGSSLPPKCVLDAQLEYLEREAIAGGYETVEERSEDLVRPYNAIADLLNCEPSEIAIGQSATSMWQAAFGCFEFHEGDRILTARAEYASNAIAYLQTCERTGAVVEFVPCDERGQLDAAELERMIVDETKGPVKLVSVTHVPTSGGLVNPAAAIGAVTQKHGIPYLLDACQSVGQMPVDVEEIGCDLLVGTGRKYLRGPRGVGTYILILVRAIRMILTDDVFCFNSYRVPLRERRVCGKDGRAARDARPARRQVGLHGHLHPRPGRDAFRAIRSELRRQGWFRHRRGIRP